MYSHPQIDGKVNHHQISRDLLFHLFGDDYNDLNLPEGWKQPKEWRFFFPELVEGTVCRKPRPARATLYWDPEVTSSSASQ